jgi:hypothetical protein
MEDEHMKNSYKAGQSIVILMLTSAVVAIGCASLDETDMVDDTVAEAEQAARPAENRCCPRGWRLRDAKNNEDRDRNNDNLICFRDKDGNGRFDPGEPVQDNNSPGQCVPPPV